MNKLKQELINFYLDWVNNFASLSRVAEHYSITESEADQLIDMGRKYHEENVARLKMAAESKPFVVQTAADYGMLEEVVQAVYDKYGSTPSFYEALERMVKSKSNA